MDNFYWFVFQFIHSLFCIVQFDLSPFGEFFISNIIIFSFRIFILFFKKQFLLFFLLRFPICNLFAFFFQFLHVFLIVVLYFLSVNSSIFVILGSFSSTSLGSGSLYVSSIFNYMLYIIDNLLKGFWIMLSFF